MHSQQYNAQQYNIGNIGMKHLLNFDLSRLNYSEIMGFGVSWPETNMTQGNFLKCQAELKSDLATVLRNYLVT